LGQMGLERGKFAWMNMGTTHHQAAIWMQHCKGGKFSQSNPRLMMDSFL
jgi:hypothetical protein